MGSAKINQLQLLQQNLQTVTLQKQQIDEQLTEISSALSAIGETTQAYKIIGKVMVAASRDSLAGELEEKKELAEIRLQNFTKQKVKIQAELEKLQKEVMDELKKEK